MVAKLRHEGRCWIKQAKGVNTVLKVVTAPGDGTHPCHHSEQHVWASIFYERLLSINKERACFSQGDEEVNVVGAEREGETENIMQRGLSVDEVLRQVLTESDSEEEFSPSDDDVQLSSERESTAVQRQLRRDAPAGFSFLRCHFYRQTFCASSFSFLNFMDTDKRDEGRTTLRSSPLIKL